MKMTTAIALLALALAGCSGKWVDLVPGAEDVRLVEAHHATGCERAGRTTTSVRDRVAGVDRDPAKVEQELANLARNSAWERGADTIVADNPPQDGTQSFTMYRCRSR